MKHPVLVGIGGTQSGCGKTTLIATLLRHYTTVKQPHAFTWGAVKYTRTSSPPVTVTDRAILLEQGKDTWHMLTAGAEEVIWVKSPPSGLREVLPGAVKRLSCLDFIIVEGNSAIEFLKPDIVIFIVSKDKKAWKRGVERLVSAADIILYEQKSALSKEALTKKLFHANLSDKCDHKFFFDTITGLIMEKKLKADLLQMAVDGRLSCSAARKIAEDLQLAYQVVGEAADELGIKIKNCQLGCF